MQSTKLKLVELKGGKCQLCSFSEYLGALEFHHIDPKTKDEGVSRLIRGRLRQKVIDEVNKCVLVCSNCHKMIHAGIKKCPELIIVSVDF
jgi:predicted HNH restriction endonuclease